MNHTANLKREGGTRKASGALSMNELAVGQLLKVLEQVAELARMMLQGGPAAAPSHAPGHAMASQSVVTISDMCFGYLDEQRRLLAAKSPDAIREATLIDYTQSLTRVVAEFGRQNARDWRSSDGAQYLRRCREPDKNGKTRAVRGNREMAALSAAFNYGMSIGAVDSNPCRGIRRNREQPRDRKVSIAELNQALALAEEIGGATLMVCLIATTVGLTGRRRAEILSLRHDQLTHDGFAVEDSKTKHGQASRTYAVKWSPLLRQVVERSTELRAAPVRRGVRYVFPTRFGTPYTDCGFKCQWNKFMHTYEDRYGARFRAHDLRALYVSEMLDQGRAPNTHKNEQTMRTVYDRRKVIEVTPLA
jgi:integrase